MFDRPNDYSFAEKEADPRRPVPAWKFGLACIQPYSADSR